MSKVLSREEKLSLIEALEEKKRRQIDKRENFVPNAGQAPVIEAFCNPKIETILVTSANGSGKSALGVNLAIDSARGFVRHTKTKLAVPSRVIVVLDKPDKVDSTWIPEIKKWYNLKKEDCHKKGKPYISQITFDNGSELLFQFHDQEEMTFESIEGDFFIFDEPPPRHIFIALRRAGRKKGRKPKYIIIGTPISAPWLRTDLWEPWALGERPEIQCFRFGTSVNQQNLAEGYVDAFSRYLTEKEKRVRLEGEFFDLDALALAHLFRRETHLVKDPKWNSAWPVVCSIDCHPTKPHVAILLGVDPNNRYIYLKETSIKSTAREFAQHLKEFYAGYKLLDIVCDDFGSGDSTGGEGFLSFIQVLRDCGIRVRPTRYSDKHDEDWVQRLQENLYVPEDPDSFGSKIPKLRFDASCKGIIHNIEIAKWAKIKNHDILKPTLDIAKLDFLSCLKYALASGPRFPTRRSEIIKPKNPSPWGQNLFSSKKDDGESFEEF